MPGAPRKTVPLGEVCPRCGKVHHRCAAHNKRGAPCGHVAARDQEVCGLHGGESPRAKHAADVARLEREAAAVLRKRWQEYGDKPVEDPLGELLRLAGEAVAFKDLLRDQVNELEGIIAYWTERTYDDGEEIRTSATEDVRAVVAAYERSMDRAARILTAIAKLDLASRMLELNEAKADMIVGAVRYGLNQVDMAAEVRKGAEEAVADALEGLGRPREIVSG
jgi:hypothetical protein